MSRSTWNRRGLPPSTTSTHLPVGSTRTGGSRREVGGSTVTTGPRGRRTRTPCDPRRMTPAPTPERCQTRRDSGSGRSQEPSSAAREIACQGAPDLAGRLRHTQPARQSTPGLLPRHDPSGTVLGQPRRVRRAAAGAGTGPGRPGSNVTMRSPPGETPTSWVRAGCSIAVTTGPRPLQSIASSRGATGPEARQPTSSRKMAGPPGTRRRVAAVSRWSSVPLSRSTSRTCGPDSQSGAQASVRPARSTASRASHGRSGASSGRRQISSGRGRGLPVAAKILRPRGRVPCACRRRAGRLAARPRHPL